MSEYFIFLCLQLTIKPMVPQPSIVEPTQAAESMYNQQSMNNIIIREEYRVASADGTESISQKSGKKRRRCAEQFKI